jgi:hypothetical protein
MNLSKEVKEVYLSSLSNLWAKNESVSLNAEVAKYILLLHL